MRVKQFENIYVIRLEKGEELISSFSEFLKESDIKAGHFTALGAVTKVELKFLYQEKKEYSSKIYEGDFELVSLVGNVSTLNNEPLIHAHGVISDNEMRCFGGHIQEMVTGPTIEIMLVTLDGEIVRKFSEYAGLNLMDI